MLRTSFGLGATIVGCVVLGIACSADDPDPMLRRNAGSDLSTPSTAKSSRLPCAVDRVLSETCQTCHGELPTAGASTSLVTWDDLQKERQGKKLYELVKERIHADTGRMPPAATLSSAQVELIDNWISGGAHPSSDVCKGAPPPAVVPLACTATTIALKPAKPFTWRDTGEADQYMCFGVDEVVRTKKHVIALGPLVENHNVVHHMILFQTDKAMSNEAQPCSATASTSWKFITGWAPGGGNLELPPEAGFPVEGTTHWVVQVHYNNASGTHTGESDSSGYQLCETDQVRPHDAGMLAFGATKFTIPPRTPKHSIKCDYELDDKYKGVKFIGAGPHMHARGTAISTTRIPQGKGTEDVVFEENPFTIENQSIFPIDKSVEPGDVIRTRCTWKNPGDASVTFGENTSDEMCFNFLMYYPAIPDRTIVGLPLQTWITPSLRADCVETDG